MRGVITIWLLILSLTAPCAYAAVLTVPEPGPGAATAWPAPPESAAAGRRGDTEVRATTPSALLRNVPAESAAADSRTVDWLWVTRVSLLSPAAVARVVERAQAMHVRGILVQVIGRGDAFYRSERLPRAEALGGLPADFDPLAELVMRGHAAGIEVHAWINCCLVWSAPDRPSDPNHVARLHPEWFLVLPDGRNLLSVGARGWRRLGIEGAYLSPAHAAVRAWIAGNAAEVARHYAVDGIHLDYIRTPGIDAGYDGASRVGFALESGLDRARRPGLSVAERARIDTAFAAYQARQVTAVVRAVRDSLAAVRPGLALSAAVRPNPREAARYFAQPWPEWLASGLLDRAFPMCYSPVTQTVLEQLQALSHLEYRDRVVPGLAVYNAPPLSVASHCKGARALGYPQLALYSYDTLFEHSTYWERLSSLLVAGTAPSP